MLAKDVADPKRGRRTSCAATLVGNTKRSGGRDGVNIPNRDGVSGEEMLCQRLPIIAILFSTACCGCSMICSLE